jgi:hypothetical protein
MVPPLSSNELETKRVSIVKAIPVNVNPLSVILTFKLLIHHMKDGRFNPHLWMDPRPQASL